jgi:hypothetical protein
MHAAQLNAGGAAPQQRRRAYREHADVNRRGWRRRAALIESSSIRAALPLLRRKSQVSFL